MFGAALIAGMMKGLDGVPVSTQPTTLLEFCEMLGAAMVVGSMKGLESVVAASEPVVKKIDGCWSRRTASQRRRWSTLARRSGRGYNRGFPA